MQQVLRKRKSGVGPEENEYTRWGKMKLFKNAVAPKGM
jgi:hypothetical protein